MAEDDEKLKPIDFARQNMGFGLLARAILQFRLFSRTLSNGPIWDYRRIQINRALIWLN
jgi:hypothetical protein